MSVLKHLFENNRAWADRIRRSFASETASKQMHNLATG